MKTIIVRSYLWGYRKLGCSYTYYKKRNWRFLINLYGIQIWIMTNKHWSEFWITTYNGVNNEK